MLENSKLKKVWKGILPSFGFSVNSKPKKETFGIPPIPFGPLVKSFQLISIILIISPNP